MMTRDCRCGSLMFATEHVQHVARQPFPHMLESDLTFKSQHFRIVLNTLTLAHPVMTRLPGCFGRHAFLKLPACQPPQVSNGGAGRSSKTPAVTWCRLQGAFVICRNLCLLRCGLNHPYDHPYSQRGLPKPGGF